MNVVDLFAGLGGWSQAYRDRGHDVVTLDLEASFKCTITMDALVFAEDPWRYLREVRPDWTHVDVGLASPPCNGFSTASLGHHWEKSGPLYKAKTDTARLGVRLVEATKRIFNELGPSWWWMENPVGMMRKQTVVKGLPRVTVTYCQYGEPYQKPTDLWGRFPPSWRPRPRCRPKQPCHEAAPRGSKQGIQGITAAKHRAAMMVEPHTGKKAPRSWSEVVGSMPKDLLGYVRSPRNTNVFRDLTQGTWPVAWRDGRIEPTDAERAHARRLLNLPQDGSRDWDRAVPAGSIAEGDWWRSYPDHYAKRYVHEPKHASWTSDAPRDDRFDEAPGGKGPSTAALRAIVPYELSLETCLAAETPAPHKGSIFAYQDPR